MVISGSVMEGRPGPAESRSACTAADPRAFHLCGSICGVLLRTCGTLRFRSYSADPAFARLFIDLDVSKASVFEDRLMLAHVQDRHTGPLRKSMHVLRVLSAVVELRDDSELAARLQDAKDLPHAAVDVVPPEVGFHGRHEVERVVAEGQARHG